MHIPGFFWLVLPCAAVLHITGGLLLVEALHLSDLSLCTPMVAFSPVFLLAIGPLITGDTPSSQGIIGALLVASGSYVLNVGHARHGLLAPLQALFRERGARIMLGLALLWSVTGSIDRVIVQSIDPYFWACAQILAISILLAPIVIHQRALRGGISLRSFGVLGVIGGFNALSLITYLIALSAAPVHYVICLKRSSILFSVILGRLLFSEGFVGARLLGALLMLVGVVVISLSP